MVGRVFWYAVYNVIAQWSIFIQFPCLWADAMFNLADVQRMPCCWTLWLTALISSRWLNERSSHAMPAGLMTRVVRTVGRLLMSEMLLLFNRITSASHLSRLSTWLEMKSVAEGETSECVCVCEREREREERGGGGGKRERELISTWYLGRGMM